MLLYSQVQITDVAMTARTKGTKRLIGWPAVPVSQQPGQAPGSPEDPEDEAGLQRTMPCLHAW